MTDLMTPELTARAAAMFQQVLRRTHLSSARDLGVVLAEEVRAIGADALVLFVVDYEQKVLVPTPGPHAAGREVLSIQGTMAGRACATSSIVEVETDGGHGRRLWLPLLDGTERLGAMEITFPDTEQPLPEATVAVCERYAHLGAILIASKSMYSDFFELARRRRPMTMASELLWELVPPLVLAADDFVLAALLEPCYDIGGDAFDYALNDGVLHLAVFDGMGHGLAAAGVTAFALSAYRHSRRRRLGPAATYTAVDRALFDEYPSQRFVTALIAELDVSSGMLHWISAGHPAPLLLRDGRLIKELDLPPAPPLGTQLAATAPAEGQESLEPGDMLLLYTDGLSEARRPGGQLFTVERLGEFIERQAAGGEPAPETLRRLRAAIIDRGEGALRDDATALLVEWRRGGERRLLPDTV
jgi:serine phosphatase RsbU (regulator of sigma subunit)